MKRLLTFNFANDQYVIQEDSSVLFSINANDLKFDTRKFYEGIYKENSSTIIEFTNIITTDTFKKGNYIYRWLSSIFTAIQNEFGEVDEESTTPEENEHENKIIILYDIAACAGNGFYVDGSEVQGDEFSVKNLDADFAVRISGQSMEPQIPDGSIVLVKDVESLEDGEIGIFNVDGDAMCKRYTKDNEEIVLVPHNISEEFKKIVVTPEITCLIQGKVIDVISPNNE